jgi:hypothetical protein
MRSRLAVSSCGALFLLGACGSHSSAGPATDAGVPDTLSTHDSATTLDTGGGGDDGGNDEASTALDGPATRTSSCTPLSAQNGTAINTNYGRLDGTLSYVLPQGGPSSCNGDDSHVHLQVEVSGNVYDVAVDIGSSPDDVALYQEDLPLPGGPWAEGWHGTDTLTYSALGIHSGQFTAADPAALSAMLVTELAQANHISIFGMGYNTDNGCHDVHYEKGSDGALFLDPLSPQAHGLFFRFKQDSF